MAEKQDIHDRGKKKPFVNILTSWLDLEKLSRVLWGLVLLTLPVTSFRYFPLLGKHTYVRPLAFYPLALLYLILFLRLVIASSRKDTSRNDKFRLPWSNALLPLLLFFLFIILATTAGAFLSPIPLRGQEYWGRALRAFLTFGIGLSFFIATLWMHRDLDDLRHSLKWLYAGLFLTIIWSGVQAISFYTPLLSKAQVSEWQLLFSMRGIPKLRRVSGFAFEASWLAGQISTLYLPWLMASLLLRFRVTKFKWLEPLLLLGSVVVLLLTYSRGGLLIVLAATGITILVSGRKNIQRSFYWLTHIPEKTRRLSSWGLRALVVLLIIGITWGGVSFLAQQNYINRLWTVEADSLADYFVKTNAGGRVTYLWAAVQIFLQHPLLGTGLGSSGLYLYQNFPDWALSNIPEITKHLSPASSLYPNAKNLYLRILAENGVFGFTLFISFLFAILSQILTALRHEKMKIVGIAGLFSWVAILIYYFMQDSFAMAELWINFGVVLGITYRTAKTQSTPREL
ncbi:MAG: O-antigen ligase family protein [Anaerolineae bacterium]|jgi:O-antigen ligase|nr:O-antigen ligase family protein [Anaerolineae bacterium]MBT7073000.1 O-antigen ligase family protein [Anaerolineae bacterium]MBT7325280.1 O-antigen ligase family protein [Anaerolineae bacterium]